MAKVTMLNMAGAEAGSIELKDEIFAITPSGKMKELIKGDTDLEK